MSREITILIGKEERTAELPTEAAARVCRIIEDVLPLIGELSLCIGRMDHWVDHLIPWAKIGEVYGRLGAQCHDY